MPRLTKNKDLLVRPGDGHKSSHNPKSHPASAPSSPAISHSPGGSLGASRKKRAAVVKFFPTEGEKKLTALKSADDFSDWQSFVKNKKGSIEEETSAQGASPSHSTSSSSKSSSKSAVKNARHSPRNRDDKKSKGRRRGFNSPKKSQRKRHHTVSSARERPSPKYPSVTDAKPNTDEVVLAPGDEIPCHISNSPRKDRSQSLSHRASSSSDPLPTLPNAKVKGILREEGAAPRSPGLKPRIVVNEGMSPRKKRSFPIEGVQGVVDSQQLAHQGDAEGAPHIDGSGDHMESNESLLSSSSHSVTNVNTSGDVGGVDDDDDDGDDDGGDDKVVSVKELSKLPKETSRSSESMYSSTKSRHERHRQSTSRSPNTSRSSRDKKQSRRRKSSSRQYDSPDILVECSSRLDNQEKTMKDIADTIKKLQDKVEELSGQLSTMVISQRLQNVEQMADEMADEMTEFRRTQSMPLSAFLKQHKEQSEKGGDESGVDNTEPVLDELPDASHTEASLIPKSIGQLDPFYASTLSKMKQGRGLKLKQRGSDKTFTGAAFVSWASRLYFMPEDEAVLLGLSLLLHGFIARIPDDGKRKFEPKPSSLYKIVE